MNILTFFENQSSHIMRDKYKIRKSKEESYGIEFELGI